MNAIYKNVLGGKQGVIGLALLAALIFLVLPMFWISSVSIWSAST